MEDKDKKELINTNFKDFVLEDKDIALISAIEHLSKSIDGLRLAMSRR